MAQTKQASNFPSIKRVSVSDLIPYANNSRTHSDEQVAKIASSIKEFGFLNPVITDGENGVIAGHGRILAAQKLGLKELPCVEAAHLSEAQKKAYIIADNRLALDAGWNDDLLKIELEELDGLNFDLALTGFEMGEIEALLADKTAGLTDPEEVPELQEQAVTVKGDTWLLGKHRLRCGDSTSADDVAALLNGVEPHLMVTDPPYGVNYDADWRNHTGNMAWADRAIGKVQNDDRADWREVWALFPGDVAYVWHAGNMANVVADSLISAGFGMRAQIIWAKNNIVISRGDYHPKHEPCWYAVRKSKKGHWSGGRKQSTVWNIDKPMKSETGHSTQKPVECMRRPIINNSSPGQAVYEPFCGSGTTIIAGEMEGRHIYAMELEENYCDVIVRRWQDFTGEQATLEETGETFSEVEGQRCKAAA